MKLRAGRDSHRIKREKKTLFAMFGIYCRGMSHIRHAGTLLCGECSELFDYSIAKIDRCPFSEDKPTCVKCTVHCYDGQRREHVRRIMRFSGPKMALRHPYLSLMHILDGIKTSKGVKSGDKDKAGK